MGSISILRADPVSSHGHPEKFIDPGTKQKLDLLPFGALSKDGRSIIWPADQSRWSILGFEESYQGAAPLNVTTELAIRIATLPAMVILKAVAFYERLEDRKRKDGSDIGFTLAHYLDVGNKARLLDGADADIMDQVGGDIQLAGAMLLGRDMRRLAQPITYDSSLDCLTVRQLQRYSLSIRLLPRTSRFAPLKFTKKRRMARSACVICHAW